MNYSQVKLFVFLICLSFNGGSVLAQNFEKAYNVFGKNGSGWITTEDAGGYTIAGITVEGVDWKIRNICVFKIDKSGNLLWQKKIDNFLLPQLDRLLMRSTVIAAKDSGFLFIDAANQVDEPNFHYYEGLRLLKLNSKGEVLWKKTIDTTEAHSAGTNDLSFIEGKEGYLYIISSENLTSGISLLIKVDNNGEIIYKKKINFNQNSSSVSIQEFSDGNLAVSEGKKLFLLDENGNILHESETLPYYIRTILVNEFDEIIAALSNGSILKFDESGNIIWNNTAAGRIDRISETSDGGFIAVLGNLNYEYRLSRLDKNGNTSWTKDLNSMMYSVDETADKGFILTGTYGLYINNQLHVKSLPVVLKTNSQGTYTGLSLIFPEKSVNALNTYPIGWFSENINDIDIYYSTNGGEEWKTIAKYIPATQKYYAWEIPFELSDNCFVKIMDSENPTYIDKNDSVFSIIPPYREFEYITANEVKMWIGNQGEGSHDPNTDGGGFLWPGGKNAIIDAVFMDGLLWGGKVNGQIRVGGSTYRSGLQPGNFLVKDNPSMAEDIRFQVWKIRKDWESLPEGTDKAKYNYYTEHWPIDIGIEWIDQNRDGEYTPGIDRPKYYGDEMLFNVSNDFDTSRTRFLYGSDPMGIEMQCTTFGKDTADLRDAVFKKYKIINRGDEAITDMYFAYWADDDLGDANDDYSGVDSSLSFGYTWNATDYDQSYGSPPPAVAHMIVQGPIIPAAPSDSARFNDSWKKGYKNLPATSFVIYFGGSIYSDPDLGRYEGSLQMYNNMQGLVWDGSSFIDPNTGEPVKYVLAGDPVSGEGWYEGNGWPGGPGHGDRRYLISSGPFNLAPSDTQEITMAIFIGLGTDNINSIAVLREEAAAIQDYYNNKLVQELKTTIPSQLIDYFLEQNYPNPFNSTTTIEYRVPVKSYVKIKIYDILGREVISIDQGEQVPWNYRVGFNASALASGIYFYRITASPVNGGRGDFVQTKKMILLK